MAEMADPSQPPRLNQARHAPDLTPEGWLLLACLSLLCGRKQVPRKVSYERKLLPDPD